MPNSVRETLERLKAIGDPEALWERATPVDVSGSIPRVNAHIHLPPNFSAFDSVGEAVKLAGEQDIRVLGASNYYDYTVYGEFGRQAYRRGIFPLFGLEVIAFDQELAEAGIKLNDPGNPGKVYICGKAIARFDTPTPRATELLERIRQNDRERMAEMIGLLDEYFRAHGIDTGLDEAGVIDRIERRHDCARETIYLQERHVCMAFQEAFFEAVAAGDRKAALERVFGVKSAVEVNDPVAVQNAIRSHLVKAGKPCYVAERFVTCDEANELTREFGGIPVYPVLADGADPISPWEADPETLIANLKRNGYHFAEFIPTRNRPELIERYVPALREAGIVVSAGTEHNTLDLIPLDPFCKGGEPIPEAARRIFWEGACVAAAHQFLCLHGEPGFLDRDGGPVRDDRSPGERIEDFARLGAVVIQAYFERAEAESPAE